MDTRRQLAKLFSQPFRSPLRGLFVRPRRGLTWLLVAGIIGTLLPVNPGMAGPAVAGQPTYTVTYDSNSATSGSVPTDPTAYANKARVTVASNSGSLVLTGSTFAGWNTESGGSGDTYEEGSEFRISENTTLYAKWTAVPLTYTVTYDANGGIGAPSTSTHNEGESVTVSATLPTKTGYLFVEWQDASSATYAPSGSLGSIAGNVALTAQWDALRTVSFDANSGSGVMSGSTATSSAALPSNTFTRAGYVFTGWNMVANGTGVAYADGASGITSDVTLYAQWAAVVLTVNCGVSGDFTVINNVVTESDSCVGAVVIPSGVTSVADRAFVTTPWGSSGVTSLSFPASLETIGQSSFEGLHLVRSLTLPDGVTTIGQSAFGRLSALESLTLGNSLQSIGEKGFWSATSLTAVTIPAAVATIGANAFSKSSDLALINFLGNTAPALGESPFDEIDPAAVASVPYTSTGYGSDGDSFGALTVNVRNSTVTFDANEGSGDMANQVDGALVGLNANAFARDGYVFAGWNTVAGGTGVAYADGALYDFSAEVDVTLYAQWAAVVVTFDANEGSGSAGSFAYGEAASGSWFTRDGYVFTGWNTVAGGSGVGYASGVVNNFAADVTLYAQWAAVVVTFDANEGSGSAGSFAYGQVASGGWFTRDGYVNSRWNTSANGTGVSYPSAVVNNFAANVTLFAQWTLVPVVAPAPAPAPTPAPPIVQIVPQRLANPVPTTIEAPPAPATTQRAAAAENSAVALVGGRPVSVISESVNPGRASFTVGKVSLSVGVSQSTGGVTQSDTGMVMKFSRDEGAQISGGGLAPRSQMQVYLPSANGKFVELPPITVNADGTFSASVSMNTAAGEKPLPIGKRFLQIVGQDEDGNETVIEVAIDITQPDPSPEINSATGERPAEEPGSLMVLNGGVAEAVSMAAENGMTEIGGDGWGVSVGSSNANGASQSSALKPGDPVAFSGSGFMPGYRADVWLFSDPELLGSVVVAEDGTFEANFAIDGDNIPAGNHTLQIQGVGEDGYVRAVGLGVTVEEPLASDEFETADASQTIQKPWNLVASSTVLMTTSVVAMLVFSILGHWRRRRG